MDFAALTHRVAIDEPVQSQDLGGAPVTTWQQRGVVWASIEPLRAAKLIEGGQLLTATDTRIRMRWSPLTDRISATWRLRHQQTVYDVVSVAHVRLAHGEIEILAKSGANEG